MILHHILLAKNLTKNESFNRFCRIIWGISPIYYVTIHSKKSSHARVNSRNDDDNNIKKKSTSIVIRAAAELHRRPAAREKNTPSFLQYTLL